MGKTGISKLIKCFIRNVIEITNCTEPQNDRRAQQGKFAKLRDIAFYIARCLTTKL